MSVDELERLQDRCDNASASWEESRQLLLYVIRGLIEKQKAQDDAISAIKLKVAFVSGGVGLIAGAIPFVIEAISHLSWK
jgi:hypothetical protein